MRNLLLLALAAPFFAGCSDDVDRIDGPGCQPACILDNVDEDLESRRRASCLDEDLLPDQCAAESLNPVCPSGRVICDESGAPRCEGQITVPYCGR